MTGILLTVVLGTVTLALAVDFAVALRLVLAAMPVKASGPL